MKALLIVVAVVVFVFGLVMVAGTLIGLLEGTSENRVVTDIVIGSLLGLGPMVAGVVLFRHVVRTVVVRSSHDI